MPGFSKNGYKSANKKPKIVICHQSDLPNQYLRFSYTRGHGTGTGPSDTLQRQNHVFSHVAETCSKDTSSSEKVTLRGQNVPNVWLQHATTSCPYVMPPCVQEPLQNDAS